MNNPWITPGNPMRGRAPGPSPEWQREAELERRLSEHDETTSQGSSRPGFAGRIRGALGQLLPARRRKAYAQAS